VTIDWGMIGIVTGLVTGIGALITALGTRRKLDAEAESTLSDSAMEMVREGEIEMETDLLLAIQAIVVV
jgi:hypothetical protein